MTTVRRLLLACVCGFAIGATGCSSSSPPSLGQCLVGWWRNPNDGGCLCPVEPECQQSDCHAISVQSFDSGGNYYDGVVAWSEHSKTMSSEAAFSTGTYSIAAGGIVAFVEVGSNAVVQQTLTCAGDRMTVNGANYVRASSVISGPIGAALKVGLKWTSYPTGP